MTMYEAKIIKLVRNFMVIINYFVKTLRKEAMAFSKAIEDPWF